MSHVLGSETLAGWVHTGTNELVAGEHKSAVWCCCLLELWASHCLRSSLPMEISDKYSKRKLGLRDLGEHLHGRGLASVFEALGCISITNKNKRKMGLRTVAENKLMQQACLS